MGNKRSSVSLICAFALLLTGVAVAQPNANSMIDVALGGGPHPGIENVAVLARSGNYPAGVNAMGFATTSCNVGNVDVNWLAPMNPDHPMISFLIAKEAGGRMTQISDRSYLKHGFYALSNSQCIPCVNPNSNGQQLGVGCSDTYGVGNNTNNYWLGPADEIDPWTGGWNPVGSHFDRGEPAVVGAAATDGNRSLTNGQANALGPIGHRIQVRDADLQGGGTFYYQGYYVIAREPEANRVNNMVSRRFVPVWNGNQWNVSTPGTNNGRVEDSVLMRWTGATTVSGTNGTDDGRVYIAYNVTGPVNGMYHYEYAMHNRDNARGVQSISLPACTGVQISNFGFKDVDQNATNDWTATVNNGLITITGPTGNALRWNSIYNFWFDSPAAPQPGGIANLAAANPGAGMPSFNVINVAFPGEIYNIDLGPGCGNPAPVLSVFGNPARGILPNPSFGFQLNGGASFQPVTLFYGLTPGAIQFQPGCFFYMGGLYGTNWLDLPPVTANAVGIASWFLPLPNDPGLEGATVNLQCLVQDPNGVIAGAFNTSNGLRIRFGNFISPCP